jgi:phosphohistidine phosphatase
LEARPVKTLWLLRHAKSSWDDPTLSDHDRPLAPRGRKAGKRIRRWAADHRVRPELVLCSTAERAQATLELVLPGLGSPDVAFEVALYHVSAESLLDRLRQLDSQLDRVLLIGHNPGLHDLAHLLAPPGPDALPTAALVELRLEIEAWHETRPGCALVQRLVLPRTLAS